MRLPVLLPVVVLCLVPVVRADAGAWLRDAGETFLSFGLNPVDGGADATLYLDHGMRPGLSVGLDLWRGAPGDWSIVAHARLPLGRPEGTLRASASVAIGAAGSSGHAVPQLRLGTHLGRGLPNGWLAGDLTMTWQGGSSPTTGKITATWGHRVTKGCDSIVEVRVPFPGRTSLAPSIVCSLSDDLRLRAGASRPAGGGATALEIQTWLEF